MAIEVVDYLMQETLSKMFPQEGLLYLQMKGDHSLFNFNPPHLC